MTQKLIFFQPRTLSNKNYQNAEGKEQTWVPWFALILAPTARLHGFEIELIDARVSDSWKSRITNLKQNDVLAVTLMTGQSIVDAIEASVLAKKLGAYVIWGGPHVTLFPLETLNEGPVDAVIPGFGFLPFWAFSNIIAKPLTYISKNFLGVLFKNPPVNTLLTEDLISNDLIKGYKYTFEELPRHDLDLVSDWRPYLNKDIAIASRTINFVTSEGCPRHCTFCSEPTTSNRTWYTRSIDQCLNVVTDLTERSDANGLKLHDPNFFHNLERAKIFAQNFYQRIHKMPWAATMYPDDLLLMSDDDLKTFAITGLSRILIGLESPIDSIIKLAGKKYHSSQIPIMVKRLANAGIRGMFTFVVGWPKADSDHYEKTIECAYEIRKIWSEHQAKIHFLEPWPGTPIYRLLLRDGFAFPKSLSEWANIDYYQAQFMQIHDFSVTEAIRHANAELSTYVDA